MAVVIDPLSVATQGFVETPSTPNVEGSRDALRIATLGWVIVDFSLIPDPDTPTKAVFRNTHTIAEYAFEFVEYECEDPTTEAQIVWHSLDYELDFESSESFVTDGQTDFTVAAGSSANVEAQSGATINNTDSTSTVSPQSAQATVDPTHTETDDE